MQPLADGAAEIQLAGVAAPLALRRQLAVDLPGHRLDQLDGLGNLRILKLGNVPVENADLRVCLLSAHARIFQQHLLFQQGAGEHGVDKLPVELGVALRRSPVLVHEASQPLAALLRHGGVDLPLGVAQVHGLAVELQFLLGLLAVLLQFLLPLPGGLRLLAHLLLGKEEASACWRICSSVRKKPSKQRSKDSCSSRDLAYTVRRAVFTWVRSAIPREISSLAASSVSLGLMGSPSKRSMRENADSFSR